MQDVISKVINIRFIGRLVLYLLGLYFTALGIVITTQCGLGVAAVTCLATTISMILPFSLGTTLATMYCVFVGIEFIILKDEFAIKNFLQLFFAVIFGFFTDSINWFVHLSPTVLYRNSFYYG